MSDTKTQIGISLEPAMVTKLRAAAQADPNNVGSVSNIIGRICDKHFDQWIYDEINHVYSDAKAKEILANYNEAKNDVALGRPGRPIGADRRILIDIEGNSYSVMSPDSLHSFLTEPPKRDGKTAILCDIISFLKTKKEPVDQITIQSFLKVKGHTRGTSIANISKLCNTWGQFICNNDEFLQETSSRGWFYRSDESRKWHAAFIFEYYTYLLDRFVRLIKQGKWEGGEDEHYVSIRQICRETFKDIPKPPPPSNFDSFISGESWDEHIADQFMDEDEALERLSYHVPKLFMTDGEGGFRVAGVRIGNPKEAERPPTDEEIERALEIFQDRNDKRAKAHRKDNHAISHKGLQHQARIQQAVQREGLLNKAIEEAKGNAAGTAKLLGVDEEGLMDLLKEFDLVVHHGGIVREAVAGPHNINP
jgi:hypothetical protein